MYIYIYIYIRNQPIYKHNGTKRAQNKNGVSSPLTPNDIFCIFLLVLQQSPVDLGVFFCRSVGRSVGLGTLAQEHQSNVHCFFYRIRFTIIWSINAHINTHQYWSSVHTSTHYQSTSPPPASFSTSSTFETLQKCALQPNTVPGRLEKQKKQDGPAISKVI